MVSMPVVANTFTIVRPFVFELTVGIVQAFAADLWLKCTFEQYEEVFKP